MAIDWTVRHRPARSALDGAGSPGRRGRHPGRTVGARRRLRRCCPDVPQPRPAWARRHRPGAPGPCRGAPRPPRAQRGPQRARPRPRAAVPDGRARNHPKADLRDVERAYAVAERGTAASSARAASRTSPTRSRSPDPGRARHGPGHPVARRCCTTPSRTPTTASTRCARDFGDEVAASSTASPSSTRSSTARPPQAETVRKMVVAMARDIRGPGHQARRPAAQHADHALPAARTSRSRRPARPSRSTRRWPTGSA